MFKINLYRQDFARINLIEKTLDVIMKNIVRGGKYEISSRDRNSRL